MDAACAIPGAGNAKRETRGAIRTLGNGRREPAFFPAYPVA